MRMRSLKLTLRHLLILDADADQTVLLSAEALADVLNEVGTLVEALVLSEAL